MANLPAPWSFATTTRTTSSQPVTFTSFTRGALSITPRTGVVYWNSYWDWDIQSPTKTIAGTVYDVSSVPVVGATVLLVREADHGIIASTTTNGSGQYSFVRSSDDPYTYHVEAFSSSVGPQTHGTSDWNQSPS